MTPNLKRVLAYNNDTFIPPSCRAVWDFRKWRNAYVPDDAQSRKTQTFTNLAVNGVDYVNWSLRGTGTSKGAAGIHLVEDTIQDYAELSTSLSNGTTYTLVYRVTACTFSSDFYAICVAQGYDSVFTTLTSLPKTLGINAISFTTPNPIVSNRIVLVAGSSNAEGEYIDFTDVMIYAGNYAQNIATLLADNSITYHDGAQVLQYQNRLQLSGASDTGLNRYFDGSDDYGIGMNSPALDITALPVSGFATFKVYSGAGSGWLFGKNLSAADDAQYGLFYNSTNPHLDVYLNGAVVASTPNDSLVAGTWYNGGFIANGATCQAYLNGKASGNSAAFTDALVTKPYFRIGRRETAAAYFKGHIADMTVYASADTQAMLRHQGYFMRRLGIAASGG